MKFKSIGRNVMEVTSGDGHSVVLVSYETPVAVHRFGELPYVTETKHSMTTSRHINDWLGRHDFAKYERISQESIEKMAAKVLGGRRVPNPYEGGAAPSGRVPNPRSRRRRPRA